MRPTCALCRLERSVCPAKDRFWDEPLVNHRSVGNMLVMNRLAVRDTFDRRVLQYDIGDGSLSAPLHSPRCKKKSRVLDIATGIGFAALRAAARRVGSARACNRHFEPDASGRRVTPARTRL